MSKTALRKTDKMPILDSMAIFGGLEVLEELFWAVEEWPVTPWRKSKLGAATTIRSPMPRLMKLKVGKTHRSFLKMLASFA